MTDERPDDQPPPLPKHAEFLQGLPDEILKSLIDGVSVIGDPDEGLKLIQLASGSTESEQPFVDHIMGLDREETVQAMAHLQSVLVNLHLMINVCMARRIRLMMEDDETLFDKLMMEDDRDWGPGAHTPPQEEDDATE